MCVDSSGAQGQALEILKRTRAPLIHSPYHTHPTLSYSSASTMTHSTPILPLLALALLVLPTPACIDLPTAQDGNEQPEMSVSAGDMGSVGEDMSRKFTRILGEDAIQINGAGCFVKIDENECFEHAMPTSQILMDSAVNERCREMITDEVRFKNEDKCRISATAREDGYLLGISTSHSDRIPPFSHSSVFFQKPLKRVFGGSIRIEVEVSFERIYQRNELKKDTFNYGAVCLTLHPNQDAQGSGALGSTGRFWGTGKAPTVGGTTGDPSEEIWNDIMLTNYVMQPGGEAPEGPRGRGRGQGIEKAICGGIGMEFETKKYKNWLSVASYYNRVYNIPLLLNSRFTPIYDYRDDGWDLRQDVRQEGSKPFSMLHPFTERYPVIYYNPYNFNFIQNAIPARWGVTLELEIGQGFVRLYRIASNERTGIVDVNSSMIKVDYPDLKERLDAIFGRSTGQDVFVGVTASTAGGGMDILLRNLSVKYSPPQVPK